MQWNVGSPSLSPKTWVEGLSRSLSEWFLSFIFCTFCLYSFHISFTSFYSKHEFFCLKILIKVLYKKGKYIRMTCFKIHILVHVGLHRMMAIVQPKHPAMCHVCRIVWSRLDAEFVSYTYQRLIYVHRGLQIQKGGEKHLLLRPLSLSIPFQNLIEVIRQ